MGVDLNVKENKTYSYCVWSVCTEICEETKT